MLWRCTLDFTGLQPAEQAPKSQLVWYVLLLRDLQKSGHTNVIASTQPYAYLGDFTAEEVICVAPDTVLEVPRAHGSWRLAVLVEIGSSEIEAHNFIQLISSDHRRKQVRGIYSRATQADIIATLFSKPIWSDTAQVFDLPAASPDLPRLEQVFYVL